ncbi:MAG TPA: SRPBCC family protein [Solirubrobacterales bacterium]|jgi:Polyketide cyclase / dehydrase and lipid transport|nr:SRPBCC family protein [Solirubrobacterales bacterium]
MGLNWAEHTVEIEAPIETCFAAIIDYETFPNWQGAVVDTEVLDWDSKGRGKRVRLFIDAKVRKVDYTLDYSYEAPTRIEWDFVEGNGINGADGHYLFEELDAARTRATYKLGLEVGIPLPGPVARRAHKTTLKGSVEDLKREAERRAASARKASNDDRAKERSREDTLAEKVGIKREEPSVAPPPSEPEDWATQDGTASLVELPVKVAGRAAGLGFGLARRTVGVGLEVAGAVADRIRGLARDR